MVLFCGRVVWKGKLNENLNNKNFKLSLKIFTPSDSISTFLARTFTELSHVCHSCHCQEVEGVTAAVQ